MSAPIITLDSEPLGDPDWSLIADRIEKGHTDCYRSACCYRMVADEIREQARPPKPETGDAHDGCHDKGWTEVDGVRYCKNCGFSEGARFIKGGGQR